MAANNPLLRRAFASIISISLAVCLVSCGDGAGSASADGAGLPGGSGGSLSGSTATFAHYQNILYSLIKGQIYLTDLAEQVPLPQNTIPAWSAETLYIYQHYLYVAGRSGVDVYDIIEPATPVFLSTYFHARACDPIIVSDDIGYVTLRNRPGCGGDINRLEIVDFTDPTAPEKITEFPLEFPYGLAKAPEFLAVCQQDAGLVLLDVENTDEIFRIAKLPQYNCFDLIYYDDTLVMTAVDGIYQLDATEPALFQLSRIPVGFESGNSENTELLEM